MSIEQWWVAERKAAEFWRKVKENQLRSQGRKKPASRERRSADRAATSSPAAASGRP